MPSSGDDLSLVKVLSGISASLAVLAGTLSAGWLRTRKELSSLRRAESSDNLDIKRNEIEAASLASLQRLAQEWESQYHKVVARETRLRRLLLVAEERLRRTAKQATDDRLQDRQRIEGLMAALAEKDRHIAELEAKLGGRQLTDKP